MTLIMNCQHYNTFVFRWTLNIFTHTLHKTHFQSTSSPRSLPIIRSNSIFAKNTCGWSGTNVVWAMSWVHAFTSARSFFLDAFCIFSFSMLFYETISQDMRAVYWLGNDPSQSRITGNGTRKRCFLKIGLIYIVRTMLLDIFSNNNEYYIIVIINIT